MGTVASIVATGSIPSEVARSIRDICAEFDERFSLYRPDSELSLVNAGQLALADASAQLRDAYAQAKRWERDTDGWFTPERPDGALDLNGIVKALAIRACVDVLAAAGIAAGHVGIGGDGEAWGDPAEPWTAGVVHPDHRDRVVSPTVLAGERRALATSGSAERGDHIWSRAGESPSGLQVSVRAADIVTADVLATALVAAGVEYAETVLARWPVDLLIVTGPDSMLASPGWSSPR